MNFYYVRPKQALPKRWKRLFYWIYNNNQIPNGYKGAYPDVPCPRITLWDDQLQTLFNHIESIKKRE